LGKIIKGRRVFPNDDSGCRPTYLVSEQISEKRTL